MAQAMAGRQAGSMMVFRINPTPNLRPLTSGQAMRGQTRMHGLPLSSAVNPLAPPNGFGTFNPTAFSPFYNPLANLYANPYTNPLTNYSNPYNGGYGSNFYGGYGSYPANGYMQGSASVDYSEGKLLKDAQEANLTKEKVRQAKLENQRREVENWLWNRDHLPTAEDDRQRALREQLKRSLADPPPGDIWSGQALNTVLADLAVKLGPESEGEGASIPLDADILRHLNLTASQAFGNPGLLKNEGRLPWPPALREDEYKANRELLNDLAPVLYTQAVAGRVNPGLLQQMNRAAQQLQSQVVGNIRNMTPAQYGEAKRFLGHLDEALKLLRRPDAGSYFAAEVVQGMTIGQLVHRLVRRGGCFAAAVPGDENAYVAVHRALVAYDLAMSKASTVEGTREEPSRSQGSRYGN
jgi:hypothetical protein